MSGNPLGEQVPSPSKYDPGILFPIPRWPARSLLDIDKKILMFGIDHWHAYELSWLNSQGKPMVAMAEFFFNADSENIVESKSLKLYLNSLNQEKFESSEQLAEVIRNDLSAVSRSEVRVSLHGMESKEFAVTSARPGKSIDSAQVSLSVYQPDESLLRTLDEPVFEEQLFSDLFRSNCPVTGAPDWASFEIQYSGNRIDEAGLLAYLCSYREHQAYHEECAERIFRDISLRCQPVECRIALNFLRRGGLDINVYRGSQPIASAEVSRRRMRQ